MTDQKQITLKEALKLVEFELCDGGWRVKNVRSNVHGNVHGNVEGGVRGNVRGTVRRNIGGSVYGDVGGNVWGDVWSDVRGNVRGTVRGTIKGRRWEFVETPRDKLKRLIEEGADKEQLLEALNEMEDSND